MKKILLVMSIVLFTAASVFCGEFEDTLKKAEQGDVWAQYDLGFMYFDGQGITQDYKKSVYWWKRAAEQGDIEAQFNLGMMHAKGQGVPQDYKHAIYWYKKAAAKGYAKAQNNLGLMYYTGQGVAQDYKQAAYWLTKAAEQGFSDAQFNLGLRYNEGQGVAQDYKQAMYWWQKAAEQGHAEAQYNLGWMYDNGQGVTKNHKKAVYWWKKAAEEGDISAQYNLSVMYYNGRGVTQNFKLAYVWESLAASQGHEKATINRDITAKELTPQQLSEAQDLAAQIQYKIDNPTPTPNRPTPTSSADKEVRWVQQNLKNLGYDPGPVDGVTGARTRSAIIAFQTDISVTPTGTIDEILFAQLRQMTKINQESPPAKTDTGKIIGSGTGFFITKDGHILTCLHVVEDAAKIEIYVGDKMYPASLIRSDSNNDLAILKVTGSFPALAFAPHRSAKMGQDVFTVGYPNPGLQGVSAKYTKGTISSLTGFKDDLRLYQISIPIQPGNSGGALLDEHGNALGVVMAMLNAKTTFQVSGSLPQNVNYAVKSLYAQAMIDTMPEVAGKLLSPSRSKANAIDNAQERTVMVICYD